MSTVPSVAPLLTNIYQCSPEFLGQLKLWIEQAGIAIPINQILGFSGFQAQQAPTVHEYQAYFSTSYGDLSTVGPSLSGLRPGKYVFLFGCQMQAGNPILTMFMSLSFNGSTPVDADALSSQPVVVNESTGGAMASLQTLTVDTNTVVAKYRATGTTGVTFAERWLVALKFA